ncbi:hypothetical protein BH20CHL1_BH20CHL1_04070 [soil metagenome]
MSSELLTDTGIILRFTVSGRDAIHHFDVIVEGAGGYVKVSVWPFVMWCTLTVALRTRGPRAVVRQ